MSNNDLADIFITHIVNPYGIWGVNLSDRIDYECANPLIRISRFLENEYKTFVQKNTRTVYATGEYVAIYCHTFNTWARGTIDDMFGENQLLIWLIDFGMHANKVTLPAMVMPLSDEALSFIPPFVEKFGLYGIMPINLVSDPLFTSFESKPAKCWLPGALNLMENYTRQASRVKFLKKHVHNANEKTEQIFGDLILTIDEKVVSLGDLLVEHRTALYDEKQFLEGLKTMQPILRTDRLAPMKVSRDRIRFSLLRQDSEVSQRNMSHYEYVLRWVNDATKASKEHLLKSVDAEDDPYE